MTALTARLMSSTIRLIVVLALLAVGVVVSGPAAAAAPGQPDFGPNVVVFDPSMPVSQIQATVDAIGAQQIPNQFGPQRYALLFKPGTYGSATDPLNFQVGYYTDVAGLGASPSDVVINGSVYVRNQCDAGGCVAAAPENGTDAAPEKDSDAAQQSDSAAGAAEPAHSRDEPPAAGAAEAHWRNQLTPIILYNITDETKAAIARHPVQVDSLLNQYAVRRSGVA